MNIDREKFAQWLGWNANAMFTGAAPCDCPLAQFLRKDYARASVGAFGVTVRNKAGTFRRLKTDWERKFTVEFDRFTDTQDKGRATGRQALDILSNIA